MSLNQELSDVFNRIADLMDIKGENTFKVLAFRKAGRIMKDLPSDIRKAVEECSVDQIEGIGKHCQRIIEEYCKTGRSTDLDLLADSVPAGLLPLLRIEGMGPKTIALLWRQRNITSAEQLARALDDGSLLTVKGLGEKKLATYRRGLEMIARQGGRRGLGDVLPIAQELVGRLRRIPGVLAAEIAGSVRRRKETIGDVDLLCCVKDASQGQRITSEFAKLPGIDRILGQGPVKASVVTGAGLQVDVRVLAEEHFGAALMYFTGSKEHNVKVRTLAQKKGLTLNEWGLYKVDEYEKAGKKTSEAPPIKPVASRSEVQIYEKLGMQFVEPEMREDRGEVEAAIEQRLPKVITREDLRGDLHVHTTASDGKNTIEEMAEAAKALGYEYLAITDHSRSQIIANGLTPERLLKHAADIRKASDRIKGITLLAGAEVDILGDGHLDYEDAVLKELDMVVASPHFALKQDQRKATDRLLRAMENRYVNVIGHPTGRLIGGREGLPLDFGPIFAAAGRCGTALEINAGWPRLDLDEINSRAAVEAGAHLAINTDAHSIEELLSMQQFGLGVARRAWVTPRSIINCWKLAELRTFLMCKR